MLFGAPKVLEFVAWLLTLKLISNVGHHHDCDDFAVAQLDWLELFKAVLEFEWLEEAFIVLVEVSENLEQG